MAVAFVLVAAGCGGLLAAEPPDLIHYQGVLRDSADAPLEGDHDMVFRFWSAEVGGDEILIDEHTTAHGNPVIASGGMFGVDLGGGNISDGSGLGEYWSLADVFRDYGTVHLEIEIGGEVLSPRIRIVAAGYALNAGHLDGIDSGQMIRSDTSDAFTSGTLTVVEGASLDVDGTLLMNGTVTKATQDLVTNLNADLLDGNHSSAFATAVHGHAGSDITGPVGEATNADTVDGKHASELIDVSSAAQAKAGPLTVDASPVPASTAVTGIGNEMGGYFEDADGVGHAKLGFSNWGVRGFGNAGGGYFEDLDGSGHASVGYGNRGIEAFGNVLGGKFVDLDSSGVAHVAYGDRGIEAFGSEMGGYFEDVDGTAHVELASGSNGLSATGNLRGGYFDLNPGAGTGYAHVAYGDYGIWAAGEIAGAYFDDTNQPAHAYVAYDAKGIDAFGAVAGGHFESLDSSVDVATGTHGIDAYGELHGGYFESTGHSGSASVGYLDYGISANGNYVGGSFSDLDGSGRALAGYGDRGIEAYGNEVGGYFYDLDATGYAYVAFEHNGIQAYGSNAGGYFRDNDNTGHAWVGYGDRGIEAYGNDMGGYFADLDGNGYARLGFSNWGVRGFGSAGGGYFEDLDSSGYADVARGHRGIEAFGSEMGGRFGDRDQTGYAYVGYGDRGIAGFGSQAGGWFEDLTGGTWAETGTSGWKIRGNGGVSFVQNHPEDGGKVVVYTAPEGDEVATYTRGSARLVDGEARVALGETFRWVTNPDIGLTVHVTPIGEWSDLYVAEKSTTHLVVRSTAGAPDVAFDYHVHGLRIGFEEASVVQEKQVESFIPAMTEHRERYAKRPDLRRYNALERFKRMQADVGGIDAESIDLSASVALRDAIHEYDPATDPPAHELLGHEGLPSGREHVTPAHETLPMQPDGDRGPGATSDRPDDPAGLLIGERPSTESQSVDPVQSVPGENLFPVSEPVEPGDVLVLDPERPGWLRRAASSADPAVVGIVTGDASEVDGDLQASVALYGLAEVRADAGYGAILAGDLLTTSPTSGHAMIAVAPLAGTVVGKALEPLESGTGRIRVLVMPH